MAVRIRRAHAALIVAALIAVGAVASCDRPQWTPAANTGSAPAATGSPSASKGTKGTNDATTFTLSAVGDTIMAAAPAHVPPDQGADEFAGLTDALRSDLQMANLEEPITDSNTSTKCGASLGTTCFAYRAPSSFAETLKNAGFDLVNIANNHTLDYGQVGHADTEKALTAAGVKYTGPPGVITIVTVKGVKVAVVGFAPYSWANNLLNIRACQTLIAKAKAEADVVIVQAHMGGEGATYEHVKPGNQIFLGENRGDVIAFSHAMIDAGADIVIGHSPHVLRGMEFYKGHLIAYSLGNFVGYHSLSISGPLAISLILRVTLRADGSFVSATMVPIHLVAPGLPQLDSQGRAIPLVQSLTRSDFPNSGAQISSSGAITPPAA